MNPLRVTISLLCLCITLTLTTTSLIAMNPGADLKVDPDFGKEIRTSCMRLQVYSNSEVAGSFAGRAFSYFADGKDYMYDGYLVIGNSALNLSYSSANMAGAIPTPSNPFGYLLSAVPMVADSTSSSTMRTAVGIGLNRDSTIQFSIKWYASKHPDSCDFFVADFRIFEGPNAPSAPITNLSVAYYTDWDVPSDTGSDNFGGFDSFRGAVWQRGTFNAVNSARYGATAAYRNDGQAIVGGFVIDNLTYIYPVVGLENDSIWNIMQTLGVGSVPQYRVYSGGPEDLSSGVLIYRGATLNGMANDTLKFALVLAGTRDGGLNGIKLSIDKAQKWMCDHGIVPNAEVCQACVPGDANNDNILNISDAVYLISYIFANGPAPAVFCNADCNGDGIINVSDVICILCPIFSGGMPCN